PPMAPLGPEYEGLLLDLLNDPLVRFGFNTVPTDVALVELDRLVVYQRHIDLAFARRLEQTLGPAPDHEQIFRACLASDHPRPPATWAREHDDSFVFVSPSNDLRFLGTMRLEQTDITNHAPPGTVVGVVGIAVGFSANFLNALYAENRLILNNGSHRAYALRRLGIRHVPCIIQHVSSRDELDAVASSQVRSDPDLYLKHARPMMRKDYFDPRLQKVIPVHRRLRDGGRRARVSAQALAVEGPRPALAAEADRSDVEGGGEGGGEEDERADEGSHHAWATEPEAAAADGEEAAAEADGAGGVQTCV